MKIGIIGAGSVGGTLGRILANKGHNVLFGVREPESEKVRSLLARINNKAQAKDILTAAQQSEVIILATPWLATQDAIAEAGDLRGKVIVDSTNPVVMGPEVTKGLVIGHITSAAEEIAQWAEGAAVVKAFNNIGANCYENLTFGSHQATAFICGNDETAKQTVKSLAEDVGFEVVDAGPLERARLLEPLGMLWINLAYAGVGQEFALSLLRR